MTNMRPKSGNIESMLADVEQMLTKCWQNVDKKKLAIFAIMKILEFGVAQKSAHLVVPQKCFKIIDFFLLDEPHYKKCHPLCNRSILWVSA